MDKGIKRKTAGNPGVRVTQAVGGPSMGKFVKSKGDDKGKKRQNKNHSVPL